MKKIPAMMQLDVDSFYATKRPMKAFSEQMYRKPHAPPSLVDQPWPPFHPALAAEIHDHAYQFAIELHPLLDQFWQRIKELSLSKDILYRWHLRQIEIMLGRVKSNQRADKLKDYFTALLFSQVYDRAIKSRETFLAVHKKEWLQTHLRMDWHTRQWNLDKQEQAREFAEILINPYRFNIKVPNQKKLLQWQHEKLIQDKGREKHLTEFFYHIHKDFEQFFQNRLFSLLDLKNSALHQKADKQQLAKIRGEINQYWTKLHHQLRAQYQLLLPFLENQHHAMATYRKKDDQQYSNQQNPNVDFISSVIAQQHLRHAIDTSLLSIKLNEDFESDQGPIDRNKAIEIYSKEIFALYPQQGREAVLDPNSFSPSRDHVSPVNELELKNDEHRVGIEKSIETESAALTSQRLKAYSDYANRTLAGHDYARQQQLKTSEISSRLQPKVSDDFSISPLPASKKV